MNRHHIDPSQEPMRMALRPRSQAAIGNTADPAQADPPVLVRVMSDLVAAMRSLTP
jgi:hypothetical protein